MRRILIILSLLSTLFPLKGAEEPIDYDKLSETFGHLIVRHLDFELDLDKVVKGIQDEREDKPSPLTEEQYEQIIYSLQETMFTEAGEKNLAEAEAFLQSNGQKEDVQTVETHLQYRVIQRGEGVVVTADSVPLIHYEGKLIDGTIFTSSEEPIALSLKQTIPGFTKGLQGMKEGEKRTLYIHPEFAYGLSGHLPPNSLLIFDVEIVQANTQTSETAE